MRIRPANAADVEAITAIFNHAVQHSNAIWIETPVETADRARWMQERQAAGFPVFVMEGPDGAITGYASYGHWRVYDGYRHTVEHSVYVHPNHHRRGVGRALLQRLMEEARADGKHTMIAAIEADNAASIALHADLGFAVAGRLPQMGVKFGRWLDLVLMQLMLDDGPPRA